ncbi:AbrB family transcriptional regulator, stage V sporulation protein T [Hathewaya proteolytica DSM 3090]|uniref:AbrB family transcriptional regulator, stage V sporulation protein T n=1 Tax=Hathewaya proteolytica DSM 3090 TaxID=1121331 RepID=A0A1M6MAE9_9CLOT|nr:stage V sporulation protein T [Hathewaya proteolytica]SHJ80273.1 AbrB family transcriptional regulator, stage V sporulation protein T [Hathewaya proteolytica DSM 3090]
MKATGIVRRIDDLGRVVIPKEIRKTLRIREGDPLEIFTDRDGEIILKKYSPMEELGNFAKDYVEALQQATGGNIIITDKDCIIAVAGAPKKEYIDKKISADLEDLMEERKTVILGKGSGKVIELYHDEPVEKYKYQVVSPIITAGDTVGSVVFYTETEDENFGELQVKLGETAATFLGKQME